MPGNIKGYGVAHGKIKCRARLGSATPEADANPGNCSLRSWSCFSGRCCTKKQVLYDTTILKSSLKLHREAYFSGGNVGGVQGVDAMTDKILEISKDLGHQNKDVLRILCEYCQLGLDISQEELDYQSVHRYGRFAFFLW